MADLDSPNAAQRGDDPHADRVLILDFGSQYTQLIARRVREIGVYSEIYAHDASPEAIRAFKPKALILSGGPESTTAPMSPRAQPVVFELGVPLLGICYGMQTLAVQHGGAVEGGHGGEFGLAELHTEATDPLLGGLTSGTTQVWMSHGDRVTQLPDGYRVSASTADVEIAAFSHPELQRYGLQFHPEVTHTAIGREVLQRFVLDIAGCRALWSTAAIRTDLLARIRAQVGDAKVLLGLSGGVDSAVVATLLHEAIGERLECVFVDTGLLRWQEGEQVMATFGDHFGIKLTRVDAGAQFIAALAGVADPEAKRKIIGKLFVELFEAEAARHSDVAFLAQGTIYPDVIESAGAATGKAHVIKSHHNVGGLPERMKLKLVEPLRELFKDEVRALGLDLGLPRSLVFRHPFPGPGLGVRILGEVRAEYIERLQKADQIFLDELARAGWYERVAQAFAVFLPCRSVGVVGDGRAYEPVIALRAVETIDFMTARAAELPFALLDLVARRIVNEVPGISRVVYDISGKPPATIEWE